MRTCRSESPTSQSFPSDHDRHGASADPRAGVVVGGPPRDAGGFRRASAGRHGDRRARRRTPARRGIACPRSGHCDAARSELCQRLLGPRARCRQSPDRSAGKRTLATRIGRGRTLVLLLVLVCAAFAVPIILFTSKLTAVTVMAVHFAIPIAAVPVRTAFATSAPPALVSALKRMAVAELAYALLLTLGLLL